MHFIETYIIIDQVRCQPLGDIYQLPKLAHSQMGGRWQHNVKIITLQKLPISCFKHYMGVHHIKHLNECDVPLCDLFELSN